MHTCTSASVELAGPLPANGFICKPSRKPTDPGSKKRSGEEGKASLSLDTSLGFPLFFELETGASSNFCA